jgi:hypothetical protein
MMTTSQLKNYRCLYYKMEAQTVRAITNNEPGIMAGFVVSYYQDYNPGLISVNCKLTLTVAGVCISKRAWGKIIIFFCL